MRVYNSVQHASRRDGETAGYIVMEYVGGKSLKQIRLEARERGGAVPLAHALAYALEILPAFGYLHDLGLVYCDFKPDNIIQTEEQLKLIDMGGVRYIDGDGPIYGTVGYQAPEIETDGPSPCSDLYTVGRTLAVLTFEFSGFQGRYQFTLPEDQPLLAQYPSYARLLRRATHRDPDLAGSSRRARWRNSSPASCARCSRSTTGSPGPRSPASSARHSATSAATPHTTAGSGPAAPAARTTASGPSSGTR